MSFLRTLLNKLFGRKRKGRAKNDASIYPMF